MRTSTRNLPSGWHKKITRDERLNLHQRLYLSRKICRNDFNRLEPELRVKSPFLHFLDLHKAQDRVQDIIIPQFLQVGFGIRMPGHLHRKPTTTTTISMLRGHLQHYHRSLTCQAYKTIRNQPDRTRSQCSHRNHQHVLRPLRMTACSEQVHLSRTGQR